MSRFRHHKYTWSMPFGSVRRSWEFVSQQGAVSFHASSYKEHEIACELEFHSATPTGDRAPDHVNCPLTGGRCWHDGTSLYADEYVWPIIAHWADNDNHKEIFTFLEREHDKHFLPELREVDG